MGQTERGRCLREPFFERRRQRDGLRIRIDVWPSANEPQRYVSQLPVEGPTHSSDREGARMGKGCVSKDWGNSLWGVADCPELSLLLV